MRPFIQLVRMDQAVRAGQLDADSSSLVPSRIRCAGQMPVVAGLARTPIGRIARKILDR